MNDIEVGDEVKCSGVNVCRAKDCGSPQGCGVRRDTEACHHTVPVAVRAGALPRCGWRAIGSWLWSCP